MLMTLKVRRGTSSEWSASSKTLAAGEIGLDTTLNKIKFGNGSSLWSALPYANVTPAELKELTQDYIAEAFAAGTHSHITVTYDDASNKFSFATAPEVVLSSGLSNTLGDYLTTSSFNAQLDSAGGTPTLDQDSYIRDVEVSPRIARVESPTFTGTVTVPTLALTNTVTGITKTMVGLGNVDNISDANKPISSATQTALNLKAPLASPTFTGTANVNNLAITGTLTFNGTATTINSTDLSIADPLIYMGTGNSANSFDLGIVTHFNNGTYQHSGLVRDHNDGKWKLFSGVTDEPGTTINFSQATYDTLKAGTFEGNLTGNVTGNVTGTLTGNASTVTNGIYTTSSYSDPSWLTISKSKVGLGNVDNTSDLSKPISTDTKSYVDLIAYATSSSATTYTLSSSNSSKLTEFTSDVSVTVTIPSDPSDSTWPIGTSCEIRQMGLGRVQFQATSPATLVSTDSYTKTRTKYSSVVLEKRASNSWVLVGDIDA